MTLRPLTAFARTAVSSALVFIGLSSAPAWAAPQVQTCSLMEVMYNGERAMSYHLPCIAGEWTLNYTGSVPAGMGRTKANYRLEASHPSGAKFSLNRSIVLPSSAHLGQALVREAVLLDDGDLALSECREAGCTTYRPLGAMKRAMNESAAAANETNETNARGKGGKRIGKPAAPPAKSLSEATITVPPIVEQLKTEKLALQGTITEQATIISERDARIFALEQERDELQARLGASEVAVSSLHVALETLQSELSLLKKGNAGGPTSTAAFPTPATETPRVFPLTDPLKEPPLVQEPVSTQTAVVSQAESVMKEPALDSADIKVEDIKAVRSAEELFGASLETATVEYIEVSPTSRIKIRTFKVAL